MAGDTAKPMKLDDLPKFRAERIVFQDDEAHIYGSFDAVPRIYGERSWLLNASISYCGDLLEVDLTTGAGLFRCWDHDFLPELFDPGLSWMYGNYNAVNVWKVLDENSQWIETEFHVSDAIAVIEGGWRKLSPTYELDSAVVGELGPGAFIVTSGWNHEHCFICSQQINEDQPLCFRSVYGIGTFWWACANCYQKWVVTHDIGFIVADHNLA